MLTQNLNTEVLKLRFYFCKTHDKALLISVYCILWFSGACSQTNIELNQHKSTQMFVWTHRYIYADAQCSMYQTGLHTFGFFRLIIIFLTHHLSYGCIIQ